MEMDAENPEETLSMQETEENFFGGKQSFTFSEKYEKIIVFMKQSGTSRPPITSLFFLTFFTPAIPGQLAPARVLPLQETVPQFSAFSGRKKQQGWNCFSLFLSSCRPYLIHQQNLTLEALPSKQIQSLLIFITSIFHRVVGTPSLSWWPRRLLTGLFTPLLAP